MLLLSSIALHCSGVTSCSSNDHDYLIFVESPHFERPLLCVFSHPSTLLRSEDNGLAAASWKNFMENLMESLISLA